MSRTAFWHDKAYFTSGLALTKHGEATMQIDLVPHPTSEVGTCVEIVEPFKHLLRATAHTQFLVLEL